MWKQSVFVIRFVILSEHSAANKINDCQWQSHHSIRESKDLRTDLIMKISLLRRSFDFISLGMTKPVAACDYINAQFRQCIGGVMTPPYIWVSDGGHRHPTISGVILYTFPIE